MPAFYNVWASFVSLNCMNQPIQFTLLTTVNWEIAKDEWYNGAQCSILIGSMWFVKKKFNC